MSEFHDFPEKLSVKFFVFPLVFQAFRAIVANSIFTACGI
jgi:hypothetical protein